MLILGVVIIVELCYFSDGLASEFSGLIARIVIFVLCEVIIKRLI